MPSAVDFVADTRPGARGLGPILALLLALLLGCVPACGGGGTDRAPEGGTVVVLDQTDQGQAPLTVVEFFLAPVGDPTPGPNRLAQAVAPGDVVIVGRFPTGRYNAVAVLGTGQNVNFVDRPVLEGQPTNFVIPGN